MQEVRACCQCQAPLSHEAPEGFCPSCMLEGALHLGNSLCGSEAHGSSIHEPATSVRLGDYQLLDEIARGGMGVIYRARQLSLNRTVALKLILSGQFADKLETKRFKAEASAAAKLRHPNIVAIHEIGEEEGQHFFSMEYVKGQNLADFIRQQPISIRQTVQLLKRITEAV